MLFKDSVKRVIGNICIMRWYSNLTIQKALAEQMENREVIWAQFQEVRISPFGQGGLTSQGLILLIIG